MRYRGLKQEGQLTNSGKGSDITRMDRSQEPHSVRSKGLVLPLTKEFHMAVVELPKSPYGSATRETSNRGAR